MQDERVALRLEDVRLPHKPGGHGLAGPKRRKRARDARKAARQHRDGLERRPPVLRHQTEAGSRLEPVLQDLHAVCRRDQGANNALACSQLRQRGSCPPYVDAAGRRPLVHACTSHRRGAGKPLPAKEIRRAATRRQVDDPAGVEAARDPP